MTRRTETLDWLIALYTALKAELEQSYRLCGCRDDDVADEIDALSERIGELERRRANAEWFTDAEEAAMERNDARRE